jgi:hypothetical protein
MELQRKYIKGEGVTDIDKSNIFSYKHVDDINSTINSNLGNYISAFTLDLDEEIKTFIRFYLELEKHLYIQLNSHLHDLYKDLEINGLMTELSQLEQLGKEVLNLSNFINLNFTAIRKILKKFDKKFELQKNQIAFPFLKQKLSDASNSLVYILQFKLIDESSALMNKLLNDIESRSRKLERLMKNNSNGLQEPLLKKNGEIIGSFENQNSFIKRKIQSINELIEKIDDSNNSIRKTVDIWTLGETKTFNEDFYSYNHSMIDYIQNEQMITNLTPQINNRLNSILQENKMKYMNNIRIALFHTFLYSMNGFIVQPTNALYLVELNASPFLTGLILSMTPLAAVISTFFYSYLVNFGYRSSYYLSCIFFIVGNFLYAFADYPKSILMMALGRIFIGFGGARVVNRRYLLEQVPEDAILYYSYFYVIMTSIGMAAGPGFALFLYQLPGFSILGVNFDSNTNPGWFSLLVWIIFFVLLLVLFEEPLLKTFKHKHDPDYLKYSNSVDAGNSHLDQFNEGFTDTNIVQKDIEHIIHNEIHTFSNTKKAFTTLFILLFIIRVKFK